MLSWLGTWLGKWFGGGAVSPPGSMVGHASLSLASSGTLTSGAVTPAWASGTASLGVSASATLTSPSATRGNFWSAGFWVDGFWSFGFWGVFQQPFPTLSPGKQLYVFTELSRVFTRTTVDQIIARAQADSLSVLEAIDALSLKTTDADFYVKPVAKMSSGAMPEEPAARQEKRQLPVAVLLKEEAFSLLTVPERLTVSAGTHGASFVVRLDEGRMTVKQNEIAEFN